VGVAQQNPLGLAIGAAAVGFLVGMLIPATEIEDQRIGPVADQLKSQARQSGQGAIEQGKQVAQETAQVAVAKAQDVAGDIGESLQDVAQDAGQQAQETANQVKETAQNAVHNPDD
jgi:gas vesicle protein